MAKMITYPNPDLEIFIYELPEPELLNNAIASALFRHCERTISSLRAQRSNLVIIFIIILDCFAALAMTDSRNDRFSQ